MQSVKFSRHLDYVTMSLPAQPENFDALLPLGKAFDVIDVEKGVRYYTSCYVTTSGARLYFGTPPSVPAHMMLEMKGDSLDFMRSSGMSDDTFIQIMEPRLMNVSRLDYAIDCINCGKVAHLVRAFEKGTAETKAGTLTRYFDIKNPKGGDTLYIGSRKSDQFLRIYDKTAESGLSYPVTRIEAQTRNKYASLLWSDMLKNGTQKAGNGKVRKMVQANKIQWWKKAIGTDYSTPTPLQRSASDRQRWLSGAVMSAIESEAKTEEGREYLKGFLLMVQQAILQGESDSDINFNSMVNRSNDLSN